MDVHSINDKDYLNKLQDVSNKKKKNIYAIFDDGVILYNRDSRVIELFGNVLLFSPSKK